MLVKQQITSTQAKQQLRISSLFTRHVSNDSIPTDQLTHSHSVMLFSTNRIKELRLRIDTFGLLTNQDFYIHLVEKSSLSSLLARPSRFSRVRNPFPLALRTPATQANHDPARKIGKYKSDDITAAKYSVTPLLCSKQIKLQTTP